LPNIRCIYTVLANSKRHAPHRLPHISHLFPTPLPLLAASQRQIIVPRQADSVLRYIFLFLTAVACAPCCFPKAAHGDHDKPADAVCCILLYFLLYFPLLLPKGRSSSPRRTGAVCCVFFFFACDPCCFPKADHSDHDELISVTYCILPYFLLKFPIAASRMQIIVTTTDVVRYTYLINTLVSNHKPLLLVRFLCLKYSKAWPLFCW